METYANDQAPLATHDLLPDDRVTHTPFFASYVHDVSHDGLLRVEAPPPRRRAYPGETPIEGTGAVARWIALYDRASTLRATRRPGDGVATRQAQRAIRSLFLYEHQLAPKTRRQARTALWRRDRDQALPSFGERTRWARCRCSHCLPTTTTTHAPTLADALRRLVWIAPAHCS